MQPTLVTTRCPNSINQEILRGCNVLAPGQTPVFVDRHPVEGAKVNKCTLNVRDFLKDNPGEMLMGWEINVWDGVLLDCIGHAVIRYEGSLRCITPSKYGDNKLLFLRDPTLSFDFEDAMARMPSKLIPISQKKEVHRLIAIDRTEHAIKIKYPVSSGQIMIQGNDALVLQELAREKQRLTLQIMLVTSDNSTKCPCGSEKKFRKCHRGAIEHMLQYQR
jgi:hypothetical protein